jgi:DNA topoisomerase-1
MAKRAPKTTPSTTATATAGDAPKAAPAKKGRFSRGPARGAGYTAGQAKGRHLVIVESPSKAKTINKYLGGDYCVLASVGHVRDLPEPKPQGRQEPSPGVDLEHDFKPTYVVSEEKEKVIADLKRAAKDSLTQRQGSLVRDRLGPRGRGHRVAPRRRRLGISPKQAKRVVFAAITKAEIERAFHNPHPIDEDRVNAQQARRILDRIVGYQVSPLLWKKVARGLSAGRVQSVAVRLDRRA